MNRRDRRRQDKLAGKKPEAAAGNAAPIMVAGRGGVSDFLMGLGGAKAAMPAAMPAAPELSALERAMDRARWKAEVEKQIAALEKQIALVPAPGPLKRLARLQLLLENRAGALASYRRLLKADPQAAEAQHLIEVLEGSTPEKADAAYVTRLFDDFAESFDEKLVHWLEYRAPEHVAAAARRAMDGQAAGRGLDLGCGTGLVGPLVKPLLRRLDGVDLSPKMLAKARERGVYADLHEAEITAYLKAHPKLYDLILAADVLNYFGALEAPLKAMAGALAEGGAAVFTLERDPGFAFTAQASGRYAHSESHLRAALAQASLRLIALDIVELRREAGKAVAGYCVTAAA